jgi:ligand-binding sensor domain-containing protein
MRRLAFAAALVMIATSADAAPVSVSLNDHIVTTWTMKDGLPSDVIWTLAQDRQGTCGSAQMAGCRPCRTDGQQLRRRGRRHAERA